jgi:hypothetical protein
MRIIKYIFFFLIAYEAACLSLYIISIYFFQNNKVINFPILKEYQKNFYYSIGRRNVWNSMDNCVEYDHELIYVPKIGVECIFENTEYRTTLNFDEYGRKTSFRKSLPKDNIYGIAVLGDSVAMGYGVNDDDTFSALLEKKINKPVYNLGVSSYATTREIKRLEKQKIINNIDTIIIVYNDNDLNENISDNLNNRKEESSIVFNKIINKNKFSISSELKKIKKILRYSFQIPFQEISLKSKYLDWNKHEAELINIIKKNPFIHNKKIIILVLHLSPDNRVFYQNYNPRNYDEFSDIKFLYLQNNADDYFYIDGHPNKIGHKKIANFLYKELTNN